ncbi:Histidinol-phosphate aminotransferase 2 [compost metagenome]
MSNFVLVDLGPQAKTIYDNLMSRGVIVRYGGGWNLPNHVRISIGTSEENAVLVHALKQIVTVKA